MTDISILMTIPEKTIRRSACRKCSMRISQRCANRWKIRYKEYTNPVYGSPSFNGTVIMYVYNPSRQGFIPATYYIYPNNTFDLVANGYIVAKGRWSVIGGGNGPSFKSKPCTYNVGCDCTGFKPSGTYAPEKFICKKCRHHKDYHH